MLCTKFIDLINTFVKLQNKVNVQKAVTFLDTEELSKKVKKIVAFITASKVM